MQMAGEGVACECLLHYIPCENVPFHHHCTLMCICPYVFVFAGSEEYTFSVVGHDMLSGLLG